MWGAGLSGAHPIIVPPPWAAERGSRHTVACRGRSGAVTCRAMALPCPSLPCRCRAVRCEPLPELCRCIATATRFVAGHCLSCAVPCPAAAVPGCAEPCGAAAVRSRAQPCHAEPARVRAMPRHRVAVHRHGLAMPIRAVPARRRPGPCLAIAARCHASPSPCVAVPSRSLSPRRIAIASPLRCSAMPLLADARAWHRGAKPFTAAAQRSHASPLRCPSSAPRDRRGSCRQSRSAILPVGMRPRRSQAEPLAPVSRGARQAELRFHFMAASSPCRPGPPGSSPAPGRPAPCRS